MNLKNNLDYVEFYALKLREDSRYFAQQKLIIDSQIKASREFFQKAFAGDFKANARAYLRQIGML